MIQEGNFFELSPNAGALVESLRAFGYNLETAIADLIDNSITANAKSIWLSSHWDGQNSSLLILDDGKGMNADELKEALRPGSKNPLEERDNNDLGRYGLGLKTASFSQCRRLTVASKSQSSEKIHAFCWDLDLINKTNKWLLIPLSPETLPEIDSLARLGQGTLIIWQNLDHLVSSARVDDGIALGHFERKINGVKEHLEMVFHRFMSGRNKIQFYVNDLLLKPWDPFLLNEDATSCLNTETYSILGQKFTVTPYVLPHHSKISAETHRMAEGPKGWNAQQGFYIYRNKRLIVAGDWFGFYRKEEHYKLARIQIDLPNSMDHIWNLDVKKSKASPPPDVRKEIKAVADKTRKRASEIYRHRGKQIGRKTSQASVHAWDKKVKHGKVFYKVNRKHPMVLELLNKLRSEERKSMGNLLTLLEETIPISSIFIQSTEAPESHAAPFELIPDAEIKKVIYQYYRALRNNGFSHVQAIGNLRANEALGAFEIVINQLAIEDNHEP